MRAFFQTESFTCALLQTLDYAAHGGADISQCLDAAQQVREGDCESWHAAWTLLAQRVRREAGRDLAAGRAGSARSAFLRAAVYYRTAGRFLERHSSPGDPRLPTTEEAAESCFGTALRLSAPDCEPVAIGRAGRGYLYRTSSGRDERQQQRPQATLVAIGGAGLTPLDLYFTCAAAATTRGWHCLAATSAGGSGETAGARPFAEAVLATAATLPPIDPECLAVVTLHRQPVAVATLRDGSGVNGSSGGGERIIACPIAMGSVPQVASALAQGANPAAIVDTETGEDPCSGALGRFHQRLSRWLQDGRI